MTNLNNGIKLTCPVSRIPLTMMPLRSARLAISGGAPLIARTTGRKPIGETETVLLREDGKLAYPIVSGIPILLGPEGIAASATDFDLVTSYYAEAYSEIEFYDAAAASLAEQIRLGTLASVRAEGIQWLDQLRKSRGPDLATFPYPIERWLASRMDLGSEWDCYQHIGSVTGERVLQVGGYWHCCNKPDSGRCRESYVGYSDGWRSKIGSRVSPSIGSVASMHRRNCRRTAVPGLRH